VACDFVPGLVKHLPKQPAQDGVHGCWGDVLAIGESEDRAAWVVEAGLFVQLHQPLEGGSRANPMPLEGKDVYELPPCPGHGLVVPPLSLLGRIIQFLNPIVDLLLGGIDLFFHWLTHFREIIAAYNAHVNNNIVNQ